MRIYPDTPIPTSYPEKGEFENYAFPSERHLQEHVRSTFQNSGLPWLYYHVGDSRRDYSGFPDVVAIHAPSGSLIVAELKATNRNKVSFAQIQWLLAWSANPSAEVYLIRPSDLPELYEAMERAHHLSLSQRKG